MPFMRHFDNFFTALKPQKNQDMRTNFVLLVLGATLLSITIAASETIETNTNRSLRSQTRSDFRGDHDAIDEERVWGFKNPFGTIKFEKMLVTNPAYWTNIRHVQSPRN
ncbi:hypothetical protein Pcac1_g4950 [Phytophthora cactorum]|nr:hypothetical protein Pcac1_g4950 [Phytophthora cactorum]KAG2879284.1 hypothetical protein PC114_g22645 [Phytophthora cactorum]KAG3015925.1 hypothetical protein PC119_g11574 [Phytophthora cactorum]KAG3026904.1 hypothetical protein PC120_g5707 [Phytophthora cactorum]KAG4059569.1 hypothetical protein PC123_g5511 [Phytophthora cactorum]